jgi:hypothetical protein
MDSAEYWSNDALEYNKSTVHEFNNKKINQDWRNVLDDALWQKEHLQPVFPESVTMNS